MSDALIRSARAAWHALQSVIADREGITTELLQDIAAQLGDAVARAEAPLREGSVEVKVRLLVEHAERLQVLGDDVGEVLAQLADHAQQGVYRPGAWERGWLRQVFGQEWEELLETDPAAPYFQRRRRQ